MKKAILYLLFMAMILNILGCSKASNLQPKQTNSSKSEMIEPIKITIMVFANQGMMENYEAVLNRFNDTHDDIEVVIQNVYGEDWSYYDQVLRTGLLSGEIPDIIDISIMFRDKMINEGLLMDLMPFAKKSGLDFDLYFQNQFEGLIADGALYGIPSGAMLMGVFINKDLFKEAGVPIPSTNWEDTWKWKEFEDAAKKIKELSSKDNPVYGMSMSYTIGWILPFLMSNGSNFLSEQNDDCSAFQPPAIETFSFLHKLMFENKVSPDIMQLLTWQPYQFFIDGNLGMTVDGNWWMEGFYNSVNFDWSIVPMPIGKTTATGMYIDCWAIPSASSNGEAAFEVLKFFLEEEQQKSGIMKGIPPLKTTATEIYKNRFPNLSENEINVWFDGIKYGHIPAYFSGWSDFQKETTEIFRQLGLGESTIEDSVQKICESYFKNR
ncbi:MAG: sugar ABC transporter substrate-binding protein [Spirochaetales bacterium]|nr:sugar ABC transporter substrate-binding protein [Spirochaetales bacterium]